jgi:predicted enzyme related to lactoylglutathione lyase
LYRGLKRTLLILGLTLFAINNPAKAEAVLPPVNDTPTDQQLTGKFIWFELATNDLQNQQSFYENVFDWTFSNANDSKNQYTLIKNNNQNIAGMFYAEPPKNAERSALWIGLMSVTNPQQVVKAVKTGNGKVQIPPTTDAQRGTFALFNDPEGALFGVLDSSSGDPPDKPVAMGSFIWMDLFASNQQTAGEFYQKVAGYQISSTELGNGSTRLVLSSFDHPRAGIVPLPEDIPRAGWLPYVRVADVNETLATAIDNGARVLVAPHPELLDGNLAIFADPAGGVIGIVKWDYPAAKS